MAQVAVGACVGGVVRVGGGGVGGGGGGGGDGWGCGGSRSPHDIVGDLIVCVMIPRPTPDQRLWVRHAVLAMHICLAASRSATFFFNPSRTAVPGRGQATWNLSGFVPTTGLQS